jgi:hypothetical protein
MCPSVLVIRDSRRRTLLLNFQGLANIKVKLSLSSFKRSPGVSKEFLDLLRRDSFKLRHCKHQVQEIINQRDQFLHSTEKMTTILRDLVLCSSLTQRETLMRT